MELLPAPPPGATDAEVPWTGLAALAVFPISLLLTIVALGLTQSVLGQDAGDLSTGVNLILGVVPLGLTATAYVAVRHPGQVRALFGPARPTFNDVGIGVAWGLAAFVGLNVVLGFLIELLAQLVGFRIPDTQVQLREIGENPSLAPLFLLSTVLLAPLAEEVFFRGLLFQGLRRTLAVWPAAMLSGLAFGLAHGEVLAILLTGLFGISLCRLLAWRQTLVASISAHAAFNAIGALAIVLGGS